MARVVAALTLALATFVTAPVLGTVGLMEGSTVLACTVNCGGGAPPGGGGGGSGGTQTTPTGWYAYGTAYAFAPTDSAGTSSTAPPSYQEGGPTVCTGVYQYTGTTLGPLKGFDPHLGTVTSAVSSLLHWPYPAPSITTTAQFVKGTGARVTVVTADGSLLLSEYDVYAEFYQPLQSNLNTAPGQPPCVAKGPVQYVNLFADPVCPQAGPAICAAPDPKTTQVNSMENFLVKKVMGGALIGGVVSSAPATNALVNLPTYFWLQGSNLPAYVSQSGSQISSQSWHGRSLVLTMTATLSLQGVAWCWGEGSCEFLSGPDATGSPGTDGAVTHTYTDVSVHGEHPSPYPVVNSSDQIPVRAYAVEHLGVTLTWRYPWGAVGTETLKSQTMYVAAAGAGISSVAGSAPPSSALTGGTDWVRIGQIEGVPYCPNSKTCS